MRSGRVQIPSPMNGAAREGAGRPSKSCVPGLLFCFAAALALACVPLSGQLPQPAPAGPQGSQAAVEAGSQTAIAKASGPKVNEASVGQASLEPASSDPSKQIAEDGARLFHLATDLKAEVAKTDKDTLSVAVVRKAEEIERLARSVKERMKQTATAK